MINSTHHLLQCSFAGRNNLVCEDFGVEVKALQALDTGISDQKFEHSGTD